jgi:hypothetical protein
LDLSTINSVSELPALAEKALLRHHESGSIA